MPGVVGDVPDGHCSFIKTWLRRVELATTLGEAKKRTIQQSVLDPTVGTPLGRHEGSDELLPQRRDVRGSLENSA